MEDIPAFHRCQALLIEAIFGEGFDSAPVVYFDKDGFLYLAGRSKNLSRPACKTCVLEKSKNSSPASRHSRCGAIRYARRQSGVAVAAVVILEQPKEFFRGNIGWYKISKSLYSVEKIPKNGTGKPVKHLLRLRLSAQA